MNEKQYFVYLTTNLINGKKYVGKHYGYITDNYLGSGKHFKQAVAKYGRENFYRIILEICKTQQELTEAEIKWIAKLDAVNDPNFYNIEAGGQGGRNYQTLQLWIKTHPLEAKQISLNNAKKAQQWYQNHPEARKKQHQAAMLGYQNWKNNHPDEYQKKIENTIATQGKKVRCITTNEEFNSISEAARAYQLNPSQISRVIHGQRKHAGKLPDGTKLSWELI